jgi:hypothetical protein
MAGVSAAPGDVHGAGHQVIVLVIVTLRLRVQVQVCRATYICISTAAESSAG